MDCTIARVNPNVNDELWAIIMCQCRCINCNKCNTLEAYIDNGGGYVYGGRVYMESLYVFLSVLLWT